MRKAYAISISLLICVLALCFLPSTNARAVSANVDCTNVRVKLSIGSVTSRTITINGIYTLSEDNSVPISSQKYTIKVENSKLSLYDKSGNLLISGKSTLTFVPKLSTTATYYATIPNTYYSLDLNYTGSLKWSVSNSKLLCIETAYIEDYVKGVIPYEMSESYPVEALKTQAICARTYAAIQVSPSSSYDLLDYSADQAYRGYTPQNTRCIQAVEATSKQLLAYNGELVQAYYSATNGGVTEIPQHIWSSRMPLAPYNVCKTDPYDLKYTNATGRQTETIYIPKKPSSTALSENVEKYIKDLLKAELNKHGYDVELYSDMDIRSINSLENLSLRTGTKVGENTQNHSLYATEAGKCENYTIATLGATVFAPLAEPDSSGELRAMRDNVPLKERTSNSSATIATVDTGYVFTVLKYDYSSSYHQVSYNGRTCYVSKSYVECWKQTEVSVPLNMLEFETTGGYPVYSRSLRLITVEETTNGFYIYHRRYGHGVGMSQYGSMQQANDGRTYKQILQFYYSGTELITGNIDDSQYKKTKDVKPAVTIEGIVAESGVNIRSGPATSFTSYARSTENMEFEITAMYYAANWHQVWYDGHFAYVHTDYIAVKNAPKTVAFGKATGGLSLRVYPDAGFSAVTKLPKDTVVDVIAEGSPTSDWHEIWYENRLYYVLSNYIQFVEQDTLFGEATREVKLRTAADGALTPEYSVEKGNYIQITNDFYPDASWHRVVYFGKTYYALSSCLTPLAQGKTPPAVATGTAKQAVYVRTGPDKSFTAAGTLLTGEKAPVIKLEYAAGWHQVLYNNALCYVSSPYLDTGTTPTPTPTIAPSPSPTATIAPSPSPTATVKPSPSPSPTATPKPSPTATTSPEDKKVVATGTAIKTLNLRLTPDSAAHIDVSLPKYSAVQITKLNTPNKSWHRVLYDDTLYYGMSSCISIDPEEPQSGLGLATGGLNLRATADGGAAAVVKLPKGSYVEITAASSPSPAWHTVQYNGKKLYAMSNYISLLADGETPAVVAEMKSTGTDVNVRSGSSTSTAALGKLALGEKVSVIKKNYASGWHQIWYNGGLAYVYAIYLA